MYQMLIRLILIGTIADAGANLDPQDVLALSENPSRVAAMSKHVTKVNWKPIVMFPEEAKRFR